MRTLYLLWKLWRELEDAKADLRAASVNIIVERPDQSSYRLLCDAAREQGLPQPERRTKWEVSYWRDAHEAANGTRTRRGETLREALGSALRGE